MFAGDRVDLSKDDDMDAQIARLQAELFKEESKLILMKKVFQLQNQPSKAEKREEPVLDRKGHPVRDYSYSTQQNGLNKFAKTAVDSNKDKTLRDSKVGVHRSIIGSLVMLNLS